MPLAGFGDPRGVISVVPMRFRDVISDSYEEVVAHMLASRFVSESRYSQMVREKYGLHSEKDAWDYITDYVNQDFVVGERAYRRIDKIAEAMAVFKFIDVRIYRGLLREVNKLNREEVKVISELESVYSSIQLNSKSSYQNNMKKAAHILAKGWNI